MSTQTITPADLALHAQWLADQTTGVRIVRTSANLRGADLRGANLLGANLLDADLRGANLRGADLLGANLLDANLRGANLRGADLLGANLRGADLRGANLRGADLLGANLLDADLLGADLRGANLLGANLLDADLLGADGLPIAEDAPNRLLAAAEKLSDEQLLELAAAAVGYESIGIDEYKPGDCAVEAYSSELIAYGRAAIAATLLRQPVPAAVPPAPAPEIPEDVRLAFAELKRKQKNLSDFRSLRESLAVDQPPAPTPASDGEREKRPQAEQIAEALARLYWWGRLSLEHGYNSDTVIGVRDWIRGGMLGDLPPLPTWIADRCPPLTSSAIPQSPHGEEVGNDD